MENILGENVPVGIYHTNDKIKNLCIRVQLRKIPNACFTEKDSITFNESNECELVNLLKISPVSVAKLFHWQEAVSRRDDISASNTENLSDKKTLPILHLFSYTDCNLNSTALNAEKSCHTEKHFQKINRKTNFPAYEMETWQRPFSCRKQIIKDSKYSKTRAQSNGQSMVIMAALFFEDSWEEIELCTMSLSDTGTFIVVPDFSTRRSYSFVTSRSETYEYELENVSKQLTNSGIQREKHILQKISSYKEKLKEALSSADFDQPLLNTSQININMEIVSAKKFTASDIFIHYLIEIPEGMKTEDSLEGVTEVCRSKITNYGKISYYGYIFSLNLTTESKDFQTEPLKIIFEVTSVDMWGNFRNEGYGYGNIMLIPGEQCFNIQTWKVEPNTLHQKLHNFFIGGMPHLEDLRYVVRGEHKGSQLSKYGVQTKSSGSVFFKSHIMLIS